MKLSAAEKAEGGPVCGLTQRILSFLPCGRQRRSSRPATGCRAAGAWRERRPD